MKTAYWLLNWLRACRIIDFGVRKKTIHIFRNWNHLIALSWKTDVENN